MLCEKRKCVVTQKTIVRKDVNSKENVVRLCVKGWCKYDVMGTWGGENVLCEKRKKKWLVRYSKDVS